MDYLTGLDTALIQVEFAGAETKDLVLELVDMSDVRAIEYYPDKVINQSFNKIGIHNLSDQTLVYCLDPDGYAKGEDDIIEVTQDGGYGMKTVPAGYFVSENRSAISRIRLNLSGAGKIEIALYV